MSENSFNALHEAVLKQGHVPLSFVRPFGYANLGDALSAVMVSLLSGLPVKPAAEESNKIRLGAVGTIAHSFKGGEVWIWGTGTSRYVNPRAKAGKKIPFDASKAAQFRVSATRGPVTREILGDDACIGPPAFGDPVWLLPDFHPAPLVKKFELGVIVHLSDLADRSTTVRVKEGYARYDIPSDMRGDVRLINTVTEPSVNGLRDRLDEILSCKRLVSTSLHGMVFAESYGIPCLYFSPKGRKAELSEFDLFDESRLDLRIIDLYRGLGRKKLTGFIQPRRQKTDWEELMKTIDQVWEPIAFDKDPLIESFPLPLSPMEMAPGTSAFDTALIQNLPIKLNAKSLTPAFLNSKFQQWRKYTFQQKR